MQHSSDEIAESESSNHDNIFDVTNDIYSQETDVSSRDYVPIPVTLLNRLLRSHSTPYTSETAESYYNNITDMANIIHGSIKMVSMEERFHSNLHISESVNNINITSNEDITDINDMNDVKNTNNINEIIISEFNAPINHSENRDTYTYPKQQLIEDEIEKQKKARISIFQKRDMRSNETIYDQTPLIQSVLSTDLQSKDNLTISHGKKNLVVNQENEEFISLDLFEFDLYENLGISLSTQPLSSLLLSSSTTTTTSDDLPYLLSSISTYPPLVSEEGERNQNDGNDNNTTDNNNNDDYNDEFYSSIKESVSMTSLISDDGDDISTEINRSHHLIISSTTSISSSTSPTVNATASVTQPVSPNSSISKLTRSMSTINSALKSYGHLFVDCINTANIKQLKSLIDKCILSNCRLRITSPSYMMDKIGSDMLVNTSLSVNDKFPDAFIRLLSSRCYRNKHGTRVVKFKVVLCGTMIMSEFSPGSLEYKPGKSNYVADQLQNTTSKGQRDRLIALEKRARAKGKYIFCQHLGSTKMYVDEFSGQVGWVDTETHLLSMKEQSADYVDEI